MLATWLWGIHFLSWSLCSLIFEWCDNIPHLSDDCAVQVRTNTHAEHQAYCPTYSWSRFTEAIIQQPLSRSLSHSRMYTITRLRPLQIDTDAHLFWSEWLHLLSVLDDKACSSCFILPWPGRTKKATVSPL